MLADILNRDVLKSLAGASAFERGVDYFEKGLVVSMVTAEEKLSAKAIGARAYRVALWEEGGQLEHDCTCPMGQAGDFCKHCVAVGLAWLAENKSAAICVRRIGTHWRT